MNEFIIRSSYNDGSFELVITFFLFVSGELFGNNCSNNSGRKLDKCFSVNSHKIAEFEFGLESLINIGLISCVPVHITNKTFFNDSRTASVLNENNNVINLQIFQV